MRSIAERLAYNRRTIQKLNPLLFEDGNLKPEIREKIIEIVHSFLEYAQLEDIRIIDIRLLGSNAAYNYTSESDLDIHIVTDLSDISDPEKIARLYFDSIKKNFKDSYNIRIKGIDVEMYVEDINSSAVSNGIYSVIKDEWIKEPEISIEPSDEDLAAAERLEDKILDDIESAESIEQLQSVIDNLYLLRKDSLSTQGETGAGNLAFKSIRNKGILDKVKKVLRKDTEQQLSLESKSLSENHIRVSNNITEQFISDIDRLISSDSPPKLPFLNEKCNHGAAKYSYKHFKDNTPHHILFGVLSNGVPTCTPNNITHVWVTCKVNGEEVIEETHVPAGGAPARTALIDISIGRDITEDEYRRTIVSNISSSALNEDSSPLKTLKGSVIKRSSKYGVGKEIGGQVYFHKNYISRIVSARLYKDTHDILMKLYPDLTYNCCMYDKKKPTSLRYDEALDFNTAREPSPGRMISIDAETGEATERYSPQIWHHKWLWVTDDYEGFNVEESYNWSKEWLSRLGEPASGYKDKWKAQLSKVGLE